MIDHDNLEEFADPDNYDIEDNSDTGIAFYAALAQETGGPVLEIACGTGGVSLPIARLGFAVTGAWTSRPACCSGRETNLPACRRVGSKPTPAHSTSMNSFG